MPKLHAGLDVSDKTTAICVMDTSGKPVFETKVATTAAAIAATLRPYRRSIVSVGQETGTKSNWLHKELTTRGLPMLCLDAWHAHAALSTRRNKTDRNDARGIATLLCRGIFTVAHVKSDEAVRIRLLLGARNALKRKALDLQSSLRTARKVLGPTVGRKTGTLAAKQARAADDRLYSQLLKALKPASAALLAETAQLDKKIAQMANSDAVCRRLMTVPGVGPITALTFRAAIDDPARFSSSRDVAAHFGLTVRRFETGETAFNGRITRKGDRTVRSTLYAAAQTLLVCSKSQSELRLWGLQVLKKKGFKKAAVACAREMALIMHRMWVTETDFDPHPSQRAHI